jgi:hypothetical protein
VVDDARLGLAQGHSGKASFLASPVHLQTAGQAVRAPVSVELRASQASAPSPAWPAVSPSEELRSARPPHPFHCALHRHCFERGARCRHALTLGCALRVFYPFSPAASGPAPRHILLLFWTLHATALQQPPLIRYSNGNRETLLDRRTPATLVRRCCRDSAPQCRHCVLTERDSAWRRIRRGQSRVYPRRAGSISLVKVSLSPSPRLWPGPFFQHCFIARSPTMSGAPSTC